MEEDPPEAPSGLFPYFVIISSNSLTFFLIDLDIIPIFIDYYYHWNSIITPHIIYRPWLV